MLYLPVIVEILQILLISKMKSYIISAYRYAHYFFSFDKLTNVMLVLVQTDQLLTNHEVRIILCQVTTFSFNSTYVSWLLSHHQEFTINWINNHCKYIYTFAINDYKWKTNGHL